MKDKVILISGGTDGIGLATAKKFLKEGNSVVISGRTEENGKKAEQELSDLGNVTYIQADASSEEDCKNLVEKTIEKHGRIDVLANIAGVIGKRDGFLESDNEDTLNTIRINLMGPIYMAQHAAKHMVKAGEGVIINVASLVGVIANHEPIGYHASKAGLRMATSVMAKDLSEKGIRVLAVAPGWINTSMLEGIEEETKAKGESMHMKNRLIEPEEIANAIYLLSTPEASAINGTTVMTEDGYTAFKM